MVNHEIQIASMRANFGLSIGSSSALRCWMEGIVLSVMPTVETTTNAIDITEINWKIKEYIYLNLYQLQLLSLTKIKSYVVLPKGITSIYRYILPICNSFCMSNIAPTYAFLSTYYLMLYVESFWMCTMYIYYCCGMDFLKLFPTLW